MGIVHFLFLSFFSVLALLIFLFLTVKSSKTEISFTGKKGSDIQ